MRHNFLGWSPSQLTSELLIRIHRFDPKNMIFLVRDCCWKDYQLANQPNVLGSFKTCHSSFKCTKSGTSTTRSKRIHIGDTLTHPEDPVPNNSLLKGAVVWKKIWQGITWHHDSHIRNSPQDLYAAYQLTMCWSVITMLRNDALYMFYT